MKYEAIAMINKCSKFVFDHKSDIMLALGLGAGAATVITAAKQTLNMNDILDEAKGDIDVIKSEEPEGKKSRGKKLAKVYIKTAFKVAANYAVPAGFAVTSVYCICGAYGLVKKENKQLVLVNQGLVTALNKMYKNVEDKYGPEEAARMRFGGEEKTITVIDKDENGKEKKSKEKVNVLKEEDKPVNDMFSFLFDAANCPYTYKEEPYHNVKFIRDCLSELNNMLITRGKVSVNDIRYKLGGRGIRGGDDYGYVYSPGKVVDFGLDEFINYDDYCRKSSFLKGYEKSILLHFKDNDGFIKFKIDYDYGF